MPTRTLTVKWVESVKASKTRVEYFDTVVRGLALRITPNGVKSWTVLYRNRHARLRRLTLGAVDQIDLADARDQARDHLHEVRKGSDPATVKKSARRAENISQLVTIYIEQYAKVQKRSWKQDDWILAREVVPLWGKRAIQEITRRDCLDLVQRIAERGTPIHANRVAALLSKVFKYALDQVSDAKGDPVLAHSPAIALPRPGRETRRDRVLTDDEVRAFWETCDAIDAPMAAFYRLRLLTAQRGQEVATVRWQDVDFEGGWWTIPAGVSKNKLSHRVPLTPTVATTLKALKPEKPVAAAFVLEGARGKRQQAEAFAKFEIEDFRGHDLRRTAASQMASGGIQRLVIAKVLNHVERDVTAVYDRHSYDPEKKAALTWWDARLKQILDAKPAGAVVPMVRRA